VARNLSAKSGTSRARGAVFLGYGELSFFAMPKARIILMTLAACAVSCTASCGKPPNGPETVSVPRPASMRGFDADLASFLEERSAEVDANQGDPQAWVRLGMAYEAHVMFELAEPCYARAVALDREHARWWYRLGMTREKNGDIRGGLEALEEVQRLAPEYGPAHSRRGDWLLELGELELASKSFASALALDPEDAAASIGTAQVFLAQGENQSAFDILAAPRLDQGPSAPLAHRLRGTALARMGRSEEAVIELAQGKGARPVHADPWTREVQASKRGTSVLLLRASKHLERGRFAAAVDVLEDLRKRSPRDSRVLRKLASGYTRLERMAEARDVLKAAVDVEPRDAMLRVSLAWAFSVTGDPGRALDELDSALVLDPSLVEAYTEQAVLLLALGRFEDVLPVHGAAADHGIQRASLEISLGKALTELDQLEPALASFELASDLDGTLVDAWIGQTVVAIRLQRPGPAERAMARARSLDPNHGMLPALKAALDGIADEHDD